MKSTKLLKLITVGIAAGSLAGCGMAASSGETDTVTWTWDHGLSLPGTAYETLLTEELPQMLEEGTDGKVTLQVTAGQTDPTETIEALQAGRFDGGTVVTTNYSGTYPLWNFSEMGFLLSDFDEAEAQLRGDAGQYIFDHFEDVTGLVQAGGVVPWAPATYFTQEPLESAADWEGVRFRAAALESSDMIEALGGSAVSMPFGDLYTSLERGVVDGFVTSQNAALSISPWEVTEYFNVWPAGVGYVLPALSQEALDELDEETRAQVETIFEEFAELAWEETRNDIEATTQTFEENGMTRIEPSPEITEELQSTVGQELREKWVDRAGSEGEELLEIIGK